MRAQLIFYLSVLLIFVLLSACSSKPSPTATPVPANDTGLANPASVNCLEKGGKLEIRDRGDLGQYGVCVFENNLQCEEWAMYRGECPVGGVDVSGTATEAASFCVISGGEYTVNGNAGASDEQGTCTFQNGKACDVWEYYNGMCSPNE
jgi:putative hemolysin